MRRLIVPLALIGALLTAACRDDGADAGPPPQEPTEASASMYCGMDVLHHPGPKGQVYLEGQAAPLWFSSARDTVAFTRLPEEPRRIVAIYVNDMGRASWNKPEAGTWVDARKAWYVIGSNQMGGMGAAETVPFADREAAQRFARDHGGRVAALKDIPDDYVLGSDANPPHDEAAVPAAAPAAQAGDRP